jgi:hypothetical protein
MPSQGAPHETIIEEASTVGVLMRHSFVVYGGMCYNTLFLSHSVHGFYNYHGIVKAFCEVCLVLSFYYPFWSINFGLLKVFLPP